MQITLEIPDQVVDSVLTKIMSDYPASNSDDYQLVCTSANHSDLRYRFEDRTTKVGYNLDRETLRRRFGLLFTSLWTDGAALTVPFSDDATEWNEWADSLDNDDADAFVQLACYGKIS